MITIYQNKELGKADHGWLSTSFHFSFAEYYNPEKMGISTLRVLNDDYIQPNTGFSTHPHKNMEIITYMISGQLTHTDSMNNERIVKRGDVQYMSAGTGVKHSEYNKSDTKIAHLFQIWIYPDKNGCTPQYGDLQTNWEDRVDTLFHLVSPITGEAPIKINQDSNIYVSEVTTEIEYDIKADRQVYIVIAEGSGYINDQSFEQGCGIGVFDEKILLSPKQSDKLHFLMIEMKKE